MTMKFNDVKADVLAAESPRRSVDMSEAWGVENCVIYARPVTAADHRRVRLKHPDWPANPTMDALLHMVVMVAENEKGERFFEPENLGTLVKMPLAKVDPLFDLIRAGDEQDAEAIEKN